jgi:rare lipoprotein A
MYGMTAAHKTLPLPTYARVTNLRNGRSVVVKINDRGPFVGNRIIDLSYTAASKLDMLRDGTAFVEVRAIVPGGSADVLTRSSETPPPTLYIQVGAFADPNNAQRTLDTLHAAGLNNVFIAPPSNDKPPLYKVRVGPISDVAAFDQLFAKLNTLGFPGVRIAND